MKIITFFLTVIFLLSACSGGADKSKTSSKETVLPEQAIAETTADNSLLPGLALYRQHCLPCHQSDGNGVPGMFPPLLETKWVNGDIAILVDIIDNGMKGEIEVKGDVYNTVMAPIPNLSDREVADILTYIRKEFGSDASEVNAADVKAIRNPS